ncbi:BMP family ABC transporter substrate-binding protein [Anaerobacillus alkaliphilus]|uniref:BMP family ABC transporter substrate-binding protein n=1 Tax=Anaerobacillus alkaliphilus TaxID=1548597 RepID=A0A4Q0VP81_9BACI|nr:BMP family ABC transporter substrate-binding protein [Anaerobacillus alkaliphilus]RXI98262.1 BMP family ABC transporter substrate-binding protein [Anaerobacillus alkaliphilus]
MKFIRISLVILTFLFTIGCSTSTETNTITKVGLLLPHNIDDQGWNSKGYEGLLKIHSSLNLDVFYKEEINSKEKVVQAIDEFVDSGVNLIFGHGHLFAPFFMELKDDFPNVHFVTFNADVEGDNITSLHFEGYSMGFFAGMLASEMSDSKIVGVLAAFPWQPEVEGFVDGVKFQNAEVEVQVEFVSSWVNVDVAIELYNRMVNDGVDVFYPAGDGYHVAIIEEVKKHGLYAIGFVGDQSDMGQSTVLTSTIQHVDNLYELVAEKFLKGELDTGNKYYDFAEGVISLGAFSTEVPGEVQIQINEAINTYIETGKLPNESY